MQTILKYFKLTFNGYKFCLLHTFWGIEPGASGSVARNSDHYTREALELTTKKRLQLSVGSLREALHSDFHAAVILFFL
jgi:hypothetical protein